MQERERTPLFSATFSARSYRPDIPMIHKDTRDVPFAIVAKL
jgi:hypothetical protein